MHYRYVLLLAVWIAVRFFFGYGPTIAGTLAMLKSFSKFWAGFACGFLQGIWKPAAVFEHSSRLSTPFLEGKEFGGIILLAATFVTFLICTVAYIMGDMQW